MSHSDVSSSEISSYIDVLSSEDSSVQILEAGYIAENRNQEVTPPTGNNETQEKPQDEEPNQPANQQKVIPPEAQRYIGLIICKECNGVKYLGTVTDYDVERKWFRVEYGEEEFEDMDEKTVRRLLATESQITETASSSRPTTRNRGSGSNGGEKKRTKKKRTATTKRSRKGRGPYIPLAYRETKRDLYQYY